MKINEPIQPSDVYQQPSGIPADLIPLQDENAGTAALINAGKDVSAGQTVRFALCDQAEDRRGIYIVREVVTIALGKGDDGARYCNAAGSPTGDGSSALIASWYPYCKDADAIAVHMARAFTINHDLYIRLK